MAEQEHHVTITDQATGATEQRRQLSQDEITFTVHMALRGSALSGTLRRDRDSIKESIARALVDHFRLCGYQVFGKVAKYEPHSGDPYMGIRKPGL